MLFSEHTLLSVNAVNYYRYCGRGVLQDLYSAYEHAPVDSGTKNTNEFKVLDAIDSETDRNRKELTLFQGLRYILLMYGLV